MKSAGAFSGRVMALGIAGRNLHTPAQDKHFASSSLGHLDAVLLRAVSGKRGPRELPKSLTIPSRVGTSESMPKEAHENQLLFENGRRPHRSKRRQQRTKASARNDLAPSCPPRVLALPSSSSSSLPSGRSASARRASPGRPTPCCRRRAAARRPPGTSSTGPSALERGMKPKT